MTNVNRLKNTIKLLGCVFVISFLNACTNSTLDKKIDEIVNDKSAASCQYDFNQGEVAPTALPVENIRTGVFNKPYDSSLLNAVLSVSAAETQRFAGLAGVTYFKVDNQNLKSTACLFTNSLKDAPSGLEKQFRDADSSENVLGLYLDFDIVALATGSKDIGPSILVKNDSDRYVMVHEFMHHVFQKKKALSGLQIQATYQNSSQDYSNAVDTYKNENTAENLVKLSNALEQKTKDLIEVMRSYYLEEMAIEFELNEKYTAGQFTYVNQLRRLNGDYYIVSSSAKAQEYFDKTKDAVDTITSLAYTVDSNDDKTFVISKMKNISSLISNIENEKNGIAAQAQMRMDNFKKGLVNIKSSNSNGIVDIKSVGHDAGCSHTQEIDQFLKNIDKKTSKL